MTKEEQKRLVEEQFAIDYNCIVADFQNTDTLVTLYQPQEGARKYDEESPLSILSYNGKLVITAVEELLPWCKDVLAQHMSAAWGLEAGSLISIDKKLSEFGYQIDQVHPFFLPKYQVEEANVNLKLLNPEEIAAMEEDERIDEAFLFDDEIPDLLGVEAFAEDGSLVAVAGASGNSDRMWELGVNSFVEGHGYGQAVLTRISKEVQALGKVPFCGTALSHFASMNISLKAGFVPAFAELRSIAKEE